VTPVNSKKKASLSAAALTMSSIALAAGVSAGGSVAAPLTTGSSKPPPVDASHYTLACGTVSGKVDFSPSLTEKPHGSVSMTVKFKVSNCTASPPPAGGPPITVSKGTLSGTVTLPIGDSCPGFADGSAIAGTLTEKYKTAHGTAPLAVNSGSINWGDFSASVSGGSVSMLLPAVQLPAVQASGPFAGTDGGASSKLTIAGGTWMTQKCATAGGLNHIVFPPSPNSTLFLG